MTLLQGLGSDKETKSLSEVGGDKLLQLLADVEEAAEEVDFSVFC